MNIQKASRRRDAAHRRLYDRARPPSGDPPSDEEFRAAVHEELAGLPMGLRAPLALYYLEGKTQPEVGRILGHAERPSEKLTREVAEAWRPHRGAAAVFAWHHYMFDPAAQAAANSAI